jgi:hypothetical protein
LIFQFVLMLENWSDTFERVGGMDTDRLNITGRNK